MEIICLPEDIENICLSYLDEIEEIYIKKKWHTYPKHKVYHIAAEYGWLDLLIWARNKKRPWNKNIYEIAARNDNINIIIWIHKKGLLDGWNDEVCLNALFYNSTKVLKWLKENKCPCKGTLHKY